MSELLRLTVAIMLSAPLIASLVIAMMHKRLGPKGSEAVSIVMGAISLLMSLLLWYQVISLESVGGYAALYNWIEIFDVRVILGIAIDRLSVCVAFLVSSIAWLVQIYSIGYMHNDPGYARYFGLLSFFTASMLVFVMSSNMLEMFFAWEAMSVASYGLIGFWNEKLSSANSAFITFVLNRLGACSLLIGILLWSLCGGSWDVQKFHMVDSKYLDIIVFLMLIGVFSKSAQMPFHVWVVESTSSPITVSAFINSSTMIAMGIFWILRFHKMFLHIQYINDFLLVTGCFTALYMSIMSCGEKNIKRILAYLSISQIGFIIAAAGIGAYNLVLFHLLTNAFGQVLLWLSVGQIMHYTQEQDISMMQGLYQKLPLTLLSMCLAVLSLTGVLPFSGGISKHAIILSVAKYSQIAYFLSFILVLASIVTSWRMFNLLYKVFFGVLLNRQRKESLFSMNIVVLLLFIPCLFLGFWILDIMLDSQYWCFNFKCDVDMFLFNYETISILLAAFFANRFPHTHTIPIISYLHNGEKLFFGLYNIIANFLFTCSRCASYVDVMLQKLVFYLATFAFRLSNADNVRLSYSLAAFMSIGLIIIVFKVL